MTTKNEEFDGETMDENEEVLGDEGLDDDDNEEAFEEDFDDVFDETLLPNGEHEFEIVEAAWVVSKKTIDEPKEKRRYMLAVRLCPTEDAHAGDVRDFMLRESTALGDSVKQANKYKTDRLSFYTAFGVDYKNGAVLPGELIGLTGFAETKITDDAKYGKKAEIRKYVTGTPA